MDQLQRLHCIQGYHVYSTLYHIKYFFKKFFNTKISPFTVCVFIGNAQLNWFHVWFVVSVKAEFSHSGLEGDDLTHPKIGRLWASHWQGLAPWDCQNAVGWCREVVWRSDCHQGCLYPWTMPGVRVHVLRACSLVLLTLAWKLPVSPQSAHPHTLSSVPLNGRRKVCVCQLIRKENKNSLLLKSNHL